MSGSGFNGCHYPNLAHIESNARIHFYPMANDKDNASLLKNGDVCVRFLLEANLTKS